MTMGRPKKQSFLCSYCDKVFKRKINLNKHLLCHPNFTSKTRVARVRSNWCPVCRRSFAESEYKLHIENEHKFDNYKIHSGISDGENEYKKDFALNHEYKAENFLIIEDKYSIPAATNSRAISETIPAKPYKKRGRKPGKKLHQASSSTHMKIKTEPPDTYETNVNNFESKNVASNSPPVVTCKICGFKCRTTRGIKIHFSTIHKKKCGNKYMLQKSPHIHKIVKTATLIKQEPQDEVSNQVNIPIKTSSNSQSLFTSNSVSNINQIIPTGMIYNTVQNQPFNSFTSITNQPNTQNLLNATIQNQQVETIPKFDYDSEKYIKWLKKFISRCKMHKYPLTPMLCQSVSHIHEEITNALASPKGSLKKRSNHFYFMKIKSLLSEIMVGQLRYSLDVVKR